MTQIKELDIKDNKLSENASIELEKNGVVIVNNFLSDENCSNLKNLLDGSQLKNSNELTFVHLDDARFFSNAVAESKTAYDLVTSENTFKISKKYLGENIRLKLPSKTKVKLKNIFKRKNDWN